MSLFLPEITMRSDNSLKLGLRARRLYDWAKEAADRGALRRSAVLAAMSEAYAGAGLGWMHSRFESPVAADLFSDSQERISLARVLTTEIDAITVRVREARPQ